MGKAVISQDDLFALAGALEQCGYTWVEYQKGADVFVGHGWRVEVDSLGHIHSSPSRYPTPLEDTVAAASAGALEQQVAGEAGAGQPTRWGSWTPASYGFWLPCTFCGQPCNSMKGAVEQRVQYGSGAVEYRHARCGTLFAAGWSPRDNRFSTPMCHLCQRTIPTSDTTALTRRMPGEREWVHLECLVPSCGEAP